MGCSFLIALTSSAQISSRVATPRPHLIVVQFEPDARPADGVSKTGLTAFDRLAARIQVHTIERVAPFLDQIEPTAATMKDLEALRRTFYVHYQSNDDPLEVASMLGSAPGVVYSEPLFKYPLNSIHSETVDPNDPQFGDQTYLQRMRLPQAWDIVKGEDANPRVVIAIVDSGTDWRHEDLEANTWINADEVADNGIDDDENGFIDDVRGVNFSNDDPTNNDPSGIPSLPESGTHGTATASAAGAVTDNGIGVAGSSWNATIMPVNVGCKDDPWGICWGYEGVLYAAMNGAEIINTSWGEEGRTSFEQDALELTTNLGSLVVTAAGNFQSNLLESEYSPAGFVRALTVGATEKDSGVIAPFSNYGLPVDIYAPGVDIQITTPGNQYFVADGTSFSSPLAAGVAALVKTRFPEMTPDQLREQIRVTSTPLDSENPTHATVIGGGYINAEAAVTPTNSPALRIKRWSWTDRNGDQIIQPEEPVRLRLHFVNYLSDAQNLEIALMELNNQYLSIEPQSQTIGALASGDSIVVEFTISGNSNTPTNQLAYLATRIQDGSFVDMPDFMYLNLNGSPQDVEAGLRTLYNATEGASWTQQDNWLTPISRMEDFSSWYGITVKRDQVVELDLPANNLGGTLPGGALTKLHTLENLNLWNNSIEGPLPMEVAQMPRLKRLRLSSNYFSGPILPELGQLSSLNELRLSSNSLTGPIPSELGQLTSLEFADLHNNNLSGEIPPTLGQLDNLGYLDLSDNTLSGSLPTELGQLSNLGFLKVNDNNLSGQLPYTLMDLAFLEFFEFGGQDLCAPPDADFQAWLDNIPTWSGPLCTGIWFRESIETQVFTAGIEATSQPLPLASGGQSPYTYSIHPALPSGLEFDATDRIIRGTPVAATVATPYTYTATDAAGDIGNMTFTLEVSAVLSSDQKAWPDALALHGNYPNPFRGQTILTFDLPKPAAVSVTVVDLLGRSVRFVPERRFDGGWDRSLRVDLSGLAAGLYLYRLQSRSEENLEVRSGRLVVMQ